MLLLYFVMLCARFYSFACSVCLILLSCWFRGSRAEVVSRQFFVSWLCRAFISSRGSISLNFFAPCFFQCVLWLQSRSYFTAISVPWLCRAFISSSLFLCFCNTVKFIVMQIKLLVVVFMALLFTTENLVLRDVKITFQQDFIKLMIMSRSDLH